MLAFACEDGGEGELGEEEVGGAAVGCEERWVGCVCTIPLQPTASELPGARQVPKLRRLWCVVAFCVAFKVAIGKGSHAN